MSLVIRIFTSMFMVGLSFMPVNAVSPLRKSNFHLGVDIQTKYIWRGMEMMTVDAAPVIFPQINFHNKGFYGYVMGATAINGKHSEVDLGISYSRGWFTIGINNYYYPTLSSANDQYFNFKARETGHWWEGYLTIAPSEIPGYLTVSNYFAGADKNSNGKQAYSTYVEVGGYYTFLEGHKLSLALGAAMNKSCYNGYAHNFGICNIDLRYTYCLTIGKFSFPLSVAYILNPVYEKSFVNFIASFVF